MRHFSAACLSASNPVIRQEARRADPFYSLESVCNPSLPGPECFFSPELGGSHIVSAAEFRFFLLDHWNLYHSMYYSQYVATKLELWKEHQQRSLESRNAERLGTTNKLLTLLAKMGIPLEQAEQKYVHMKHNMKIRLQEKLRESDELRIEFNLDNIVCQTFRKERKNCPPIAANQCVEICNAMLCMPLTVRRNVL